MSDTVRDLLASIDDVLGDAPAPAPAPAAVVTPEAEAPERRSTVTDLEYDSVRDSMVRRGLISQRPVPPMPPLPPAVPPHLALSQAQAELDQLRGQGRGDVDQVTEDQGAEDQDQGAEETPKKSAWWWSKPGEEAAPEEAASEGAAEAAPGPAQAAPVVAVAGGAPTGGAPAAAPKGPNARLRWLAYNGTAGGAGSLALWALTGDPMEGAALVGRMSASLPQMTAAGLALGAAYGGWRAGGLLRGLLPGPFGLVARPGTATVAALWGAGTAPLLADVLAESGPWGALLAPALATAPLAAAFWHELDRRAVQRALPVRWAARIPLATLTLSALLYAPGALL